MSRDFLSECKKPRFHVSQEGGAGSGKVEAVCRASACIFLCTGIKSVPRGVARNIKLGLLGLRRSAVTPLGVPSSVWHVLSLPLSLAGLQSETKPALWPLFFFPNHRAFKSHLMGSSQIFSKRRGKNAFLPDILKHRPRMNVTLTQPIPFQGVQAFKNPKLPPHPGVHRHGWEHMSIHRFMHSSSTLGFLPSYERTQPILLFESSVWKHTLEHLNWVCPLQR